MYHKQKLEKYLCICTFSSCYLLKLKPLWEEVPKLTWPMLLFLTIIKKIFTAPWKSHFFKRANTFPWPIFLHPRLLLFLCKPKWQYPNTEIRLFGLNQAPLSDQPVRGRHLPGPQDAPSTCLWSICVVSSDWLWLTVLFFPSWLSLAVSFFPPFCHYMFLLFLGLLKRLRNWL